MIRPSAPLAVVLLAILAVTACGSGSGSAGGATSSAHKQAAVVSAPSSVRTGRLTEEFDAPLPSDAANAAVVAGFRQAMVFYNTSQADRRLVAPVTDYVTGSMLKALERTIAAFKKQDLVPAGTDRLFRTTVTSITGDSAELTTCDDGSKYTEVNPVTGAVDPSFVNVPLDDQYIFETWRMTRLDGHWAIASITVVNPPAAAAKQCLP